MSRSDQRNETIRRQEGPPREFSRIPVVIPVRVEILPASQSGVLTSVPGVLLNFACGGGKVRVRWELASGRRVVISLPVGSPGLRLLAEVVWGSQSGGFGKEPVVFGVRWINPLSIEAVQGILLGQGLASPGEVAHAPRV